MIDKLIEVPKTWRDIVEAIGYSDACKVIGVLPEYVAGSEGKKARHLSMYVPQKIDGSKYAELYIKAIGKEKTQELITKLGRETFYPVVNAKHAKAFRNMAVIDRHGEGASIKAIAVLFDMSERQVRNIINKQE
jgi:Mor family transcriptional regulator